MTVAFEIPNPLTLHRCTFDKRTWRMSPFVTIWHVDPERGGNDDSCGFSFHRVSPQEADACEKMARREFMFMVGEYGYEMGPIEMVYWIWHDMARERFNRWGITHAEYVYVFSLATNPCDNVRSLVCRAVKNQDAFVALWKTVYRCFRTYHRRWWERPRWHFWHWKIQIHPLQNFKRWLFGRCCKCGSGFSWGYTPVSSSWGGGGPVWFRSEPGIYHSDCAQPAKDGPMASTVDAADPSE